MVARHVIFTPDKSVAVRHNLEDTVGFLSAVQVGRKAARFIGADFLGTFRSVRFFRFHRLLIYCRLFSLVLLFFFCFFFFIQSKHSFYHIAFFHGRHTFDAPDFCKLL